MTPGRLMPVAAVTLALLLGIVLVALTGVPVGDALSAFADGAWGSPYAIGASVNRAVIFALVGIGFVLADRARLTNVGGEGQIAVGAIAATAVSLYGGMQGLPLGLAFILPLVAGTLAGAAWGALPGVLKARAGTNEVISTLMLSFIGVWLLYWSVQSDRLLRQPMSNSGTLPESLEIPGATKLPFFFGDESMPLNIGLPLTVLPTAGLSRIAEEVSAYEADEQVYHGKVPVLTAISMLKLSEGLWAKVPGWTLPTLTLHGDADQLTDVNGSRRFDREISSVDKTYIEVAGGYHELFNDTVSAKVNGTLIEWLGARS